MPINEFRNPASNLTTQQQNEAMASLYSPPQQQGNVNISLTPEQYRLLQMLQAQAGNLMDQPIKEFDLNKPPVEPYRYHEFPQMLYQHETRQYRIVSSPSERQAVMEEGWRTEPFPTETIELEYNPVEDPSGEAINKLAKRRNKA